MTKGVASKAAKTVAEGVVATADEAVAKGGGRHVHDLNVASTAGLWLGLLVASAASMPRQLTGLWPM